MIPPFDDAGGLPPGLNTAAWAEFRARFCRFVQSDRRMITDQKQFEVTQEHLRRLELALAQLRHSASEIEFRSQAPPVIEHIRRLRSEIDTYLGIGEAESVP